jgi:DNA-binding NtrC family response regulator
VLAFIHEVQKMNGMPNSPVVPIEDVPPEDVTPYRRVVMVVDDEMIIADTLAQILSQHGYAALAAYDGEDALETALMTPPEMLITDVILPGMNGVELAVTIQRIYPDCKIVLFSGQAVTSDLLEAAHRAGHHFTLLNKPLPPQQLVALVGEQLNPHAAQQGTVSAKSAAQSA